MPELDVVYLLKPDINDDPEELRYSLRSVEKNFPHRKVWFICGCPQGMKPDGYIKHIQSGPTKWDRIKSSMWKAIECPDITEDFYLFNDDFFVMKPFKGEFVNFIDGDLEKRILELSKLNKWLAPYGRTLYKAQQELRSLGYSEWNFDVHLPMLVNKSKMAEAINLCSSPQMRSLYGNISGCEYVQHKDVKVYDLDEVPPKTVDFLSTNEKTFANGKVGEFIRNKFPKPSRFET